MKLRRLLSDRHSKRDLARSEDWAAPLVSFQREVNRMFDDFFGSALLAPREAAGFMPRVDVSESQKEIVVKAELPGMDEKDVDVSLERGLLIIKGSKREEKEREEGNFYQSECSFGSFRREIAVPDGLDEDNVKASFKKGVLKVVLPRLTEAKQGRSIIIEGQ